MYNVYIDSLLSLRRDIDSRIDNEIEETMRGRGCSSNLRLSLLHILDDNCCLSGKYAEHEVITEDAVIKDLANKLVESEMQVVKLTVGDVNCPYSIYNIKKPVESCDEFSCAECHKKFDELMEGYLRSKYGLNKK